MTMKKAFQTLVESFSPWHFIWIAVLFSLFSTLVVTIALSYLWWGDIRYDIIRFCSIVGIVVSFIVSAILVFIIFNLYEEKAANKLLQREVSERQQAERAFREIQDQLEQRVDERTEELAKTNLELMVKIREARSLEEKLRESEAQYRAIVEDQTEMICRYQPDGTLTFVNEAFCRYFCARREELLGKNFFSYIPTEDRDAIIEKVSLLSLNNPQVTVEHQIDLPGDLSGWNLWTNRVVFDERGWISHYQGVGRDITGHKKIEERLLQAHKMEAIGALAAGVAHDFNNILNSIFGHLEVLLRTTTVGTPVHSGIEEISKACKRAADLVKQILTFSRQSGHKQKTVYLQPLIEEVMKLQQSTMPKNIVLRQTIDPGCGPVIADPTQIHAVIMNLTTNSCQAMAKTGGILDISLQEEDISLDWTIDHDQLEPGRYVRLRVSDTGHGMDAETIDKIFDPYFTTKEGDEGTGLGLAIIQGIVHSHHGTILVESEIGHGAVFEVYLPLAPQKDDSAKPKKDKTISPVGGVKHILFVDDEKTAVQVWSMALRQVGFVVTGCTDPLEAVELFSKAPEKYDLVVTDQSMPGLSGMQMAAEIAAIRPGTPILLATGWNDEIDEAEARKVGIREIIGKPHEMDDLLRAFEIVTS